MKRCPRCDTVKPTEHFQRDRSRRDGLAPRCADCSRELRNRWNAANRDRARETSRASQDRNRDRVNERQRERDRENPLAYIEGRYGISAGDYERMYTSQGGSCAICKEPHARLHIDHNHSTGEVRGLLCKKCNLALGLLRDDPEIASRAAGYLRSASAMSISLERSA